MEINLYKNDKYIGFWSKDKVFLQRCPECNRENYAPSVMDGCCSWCGYDANKDDMICKEKKCKAS